MTGKKKKRTRERRRRIALQILLKRVLPAAALAVCIFIIIKLPGVIHSSAESASANASRNDQTEVSGNAMTLIKTGNGQASEISAGSAQDTANGTASDKEKQYTAAADGNTKQMNGEVISTYGVLIDVSADRIVAERNPDERINPASMTKIMTVLVAAEHVKNLDDNVTVTIQNTDYSYENDCSNVGFEVGETVPVRDLFYGTILPSGADAADALAVYTAGSEESFVELMNRKLDELGIADSAHFTNCVGLYDKDHYCTAYDMAVILKAALDNDLCREVMSTHTYTTSKTAEHPDGIEISNWFLRRIEDKDTGGTVICAKTGYVVQSGNCAASYALSGSGRGYICVTAGSTSAWRCIYDHVAAYKAYMQ